MQKNVLFGLLGKLSSVLAVVLLILSVVLVGASYFGLTENKLAGAATTAFAAVTAIFSLVITNFENFKQARQIGSAAEIAHHLSNGEIFDDFPEDEDELVFALKETSDYLREKAAVTDKIAKGDLSANLNPRSDSDVLGNSLKNMIEKLRASVQTQDERERLEKSIKQLLDEVSEVAAGDLTVQAEVSAEMTGAIARSFNYMTTELRSLIKQVKDVTFQVSASANAINDTTEQLADFAHHLGNLEHGFADSGSFGKRRALSAGCRR
jgi:methyl-accepting chemotaxis protein